MTERIRIGQLATRADCPVETIRYYEREGLLLEPERSGSNYRLYDETHVERLRFIRHCRSLDMTLEEIRALLGFQDAPEQNCHAVTVLLDEHIDHVASRIVQLKKLERRLKGMRKLCSAVRSAKDCGILHKLASDAVRSPPKRSAGHVQGAHARTK